MKKNSFKKWVKLVIGIILSMLIVLVGTVVYVDPFFVYHKPNDRLYYPYSDVMYQGAGIVKNFDYNTLVTGTSLVQNVKTSTVESLFGGVAVKVPLCGMSFSKICRLIELAIENNPQLDTVIMNIDNEILLSDEKSDDDGFPDYLYDNNVLNDVNYLINKSVIFEKSVESIFNPSDKIQEDFDSAFSSEKQFYFAEYVVKTQSITVNSNTDFERQRNTIKRNIALYESVVKANPGIKFEIIIPPKSVMSVKELTENGLVEFTVQYLIDAVACLIDYENVSIHMFQDNLDIVGNLYNYCDFKHFSAKVSEDVIYAIKNKTDLLTKENYVEEISKIKIIAETFDYSVFSAEAYPVKGEEDINEYLHIISDDKKYDVYVSCFEKSEFSVNQETKNQFDLCGISIESVVLNGGQYNQKTENNKCEFGANGEIVINGIDYSMGLPGVNIVVYDRELDRVIDSSNFSGENLSECTRTKSVRKDS